MVVVLKHGSNKKSVIQTLKKIQKGRKKSGLDSFKYLGVIKLKKDALEIQNELRNEW